MTGLAQTPGQLLALRFVAALGIGGEWGAGASMIAEVFPKASRALALAIIGIFAYWGTNFRVNSRFTELLRAPGVEPAAITSGVRRALIVLNVGNMVGFLSFIPLTNRWGRRSAFAIFHVGALISMPAAYLLSNDYATGLLLFFVAGLFTSGIYSGYTIYFPELFPTRVRATGASFCYNVGRIVAAPGPVLMGWLTGALEQTVPAGQQVAYAGAIMGCVYLLGLGVIPFLPETRGTDLD